MTTPGKRRLWITGLLCLLILTVNPVSSAQKPTAADVPDLVKQLKNKDARVRASPGTSGRRSGPPRRNEAGARRLEKSAFTLSRSGVQDPTGREIAHGEVAVSRQSA